MNSQGAWNVSDAAAPWGIVIINPPTDLSIDRIKVYYDCTILNSRRIGADVVKICHRHGHGPVSVKGAAVEACGTVQSSDLGARKEAVAAVACVREQIWVDSLPKRENLRCPDKMLSRLAADNVYRYLFDGSVFVQDGGGGGGPEDGWVKRGNSNGFL